MHLHTAARHATMLRLNDNGDALWLQMFPNAVCDFGGQAFLPVALEKLSRLSDIRRKSGLPFRIGVDGGISASTIAAAAKAGAELLVAGSAVIRSGDYEAAIRNLEHLAREAA